MKPLALAAGAARAAGRSAKSTSVLKALGWSLASALVAWGLGAVPVVNEWATAELGEASLPVLLVVPALNTILVYLKDLVDQARGK